jgi:hypothetical protein
MRRAVPATLIAALAAAAPAEAMPVADVSAALPRITAKGVGQVKLGMRFGELRQNRRVGRLRRGCELAPDERIARLRSPLRGAVTFVERKATRITVTRGAAARGVRIGDRIRDIRDAYPRARVDRSTEGMFGITLVKVPKRGGGRIQFSVPVESGEIDLIAVPVVRFCE